MNIRMLLPRFGGRTMLVTSTADRRPPTADRRSPITDHRSPITDHGRASAALRTFRAKQNGRA
ncbi:hypothetical protein [Burkholderia pseudomallei]|uniref:hypothetical protein n=2 Tax=Burkholderia pseudomallei TaxID=28450 RepID=UPI0005723A02|nr:hypothetical protein [Burkholderia pseudomallei]MBF3677618.1 hypothetical protein [Burkholderia pseudomallei]MBF4008670.1 hypothetical protein [Burkholderia pseudomallei]QUN79904.1 hypothetical protein KEX45_13020 [Burkholderia pseudomallei]QUN85799.1 hypothetical protein KEX46_13060 [Burkholderia pseudomallei]QUN91758.1 hypothetical protein KEX44_13440 [Burkholderia pseudomallei]